MYSFKVVSVQTCQNSINIKERNEEKILNKHPIKKLIGQVITDIVVKEYDVYGDQNVVGEQFTFILSDGKKVSFFTDGGDSEFIGHATLADGLAKQEYF